MDDTMLDTFNPVEAADAETDIACDSSFLQVFSPSQSAEPSPACRSGAAGVPWSSFSPLRSPDWRWKSLHENAGDSEFDAVLSVESSIVRAAQLLREQAGDGCNQETAAIPATMVEAHGIYADDDVISWLLEAGILSQADDAAIGEILGLKPELIAVYEQLFFNVRERLSARDYVLHVITREQLKPRPPRVGVVQRMAYQGGPEALRAALSALGGPEGLSGRQLPEVDLSATDGRDRARLLLCIELNALSANELSPLLREELATWNNEMRHSWTQTRDYRANWDVVLRSLSDELGPAAMKVSTENNSTAVESLPSISECGERAA